jgi:hypothetical protein
VETITDYINFTVEEHSIIKTFTQRHYHKPWLTPDIHAMLKQKAAAYRAGTDLKEINKNLKAAITTAKQKYKSSMLDSMSSNIKRAWNGIRTMSNLDSKSNNNLLTNSESRSLGNDLNTFYCRYDTNTMPTTAPNVPHKCLTNSKSHPITAEEVMSAFNSVKINKSSGPDGMPAMIIKNCAFQLVPIFHRIFNKCLEDGCIPRIWKLAEIYPLPKKTNCKTLNDYRPIALTSILMKCFEHILKARLLRLVSLDKCQFAYTKYRSTKDACASLDFILRSHCDIANNYARVLFVNFSSAFNTINQIF